MRKWGAIAAATGAALTLGVASNVAGRVAAQSHLGRAVELASLWDPSSILWLLPALLVAGACGYAAASRSRAMFLVPLLVLPPYAFLTYRGKYDAARALAAHAWTASALSEGMSCFAAIGFAMIAIPIAFVIASWFPMRDQEEKRI